ncbi:AbiH family protein [Flavobacterium terrae]|uniref:Bacteriophage abortive infection AbiH n=1 Tax=Flavobacterium terrae TaxID=415425 RepID=A0A1M6ENH6_9FLAO|nr:AbiH family protein [Flavobacterium terrae]SHI87077.1 Bacteriophage abortive infection AbiH [Flavobacterium terrae]
MKILYIIGNGFDINLGLKTRYTNFYEYYIKSHSNSVTVNTLKNHIDKNFENWSDLELAIGTYTEQFSTVDEFIEVYEDIGDNLGDYLKDQETSFDFSKINISKLKDYLAYPEKSLPKADEEILISFKNNWPSVNWEINIITLNYTNSLEKIFDNKYTNLILGTHHRSNIILKGMEHIHGYCEDRMIMGVNDISQIKNQSFHNNQDILDALVKPNCNKANKHTIDNLCDLQISQANLICIFGSSIGDTDNYWWQAIGEQLKKGAKLIIFTRGKEISKRWSYKRAKSEREMKNYFLNKTNLNDIEKEDFRDNIFVAVNTGMFSNLINEEL